MSDDTKGKLLLLPPRSVFEPPEPERPTLADYYKHQLELERKLRKVLVGLMLFVLLAVSVGGMLLGRYADDRIAEAVTEARQEVSRACQERVKDETARTFSLVCSGERQCPKRELP